MFDALNGSSLLAAAATAAVAAAIDDAADDAAGAGAAADATPTAAAADATTAAAEATGNGEGGSASSAELVMETDADAAIPSRPKAAISPVATTPTDAVLRTGKDYPSSYSPAKRLRLDADIVSSSGGMVIVPEHTCPTCDILHDTEGELNAHYDANPAHIPQLAVAKPAAGSLLDVTQGNLSLASAPCTPGTQSPGMHSSNGAAAGGVSPGILSNPTDVDTDNDDGVQLNPHSPVQSNDSDIQVISDNDSD